MTDELQRAAAASIAMVTILAAVPVVDRVIYWLGFLAGRLWRRAEHALRERKARRTA